MWAGKVDRLEHMPTQVIAMTSASLGGEEWIPYLRRWQKEERANFGRNIALGGRWAYRSVKRVLGAFS